MRHSRFEVAAGIQRAADDNTDHKRRINLFGDERQHNGDDRRKQRPERGVDFHILTNGVDRGFDVCLKIGIALKVARVIVEIRQRPFAVGHVNDLILRVFDVGSQQDRIFFKRADGFHGLAVNSLAVFDLFGVFKLLRRSGIGRRDGIVADDLFGVRGDRGVRRVRAFSSPMSASASAPLSVMNAEILPSIKVMTHITSTSRKRLVFGFLMEKTSFLFLINTNG